MHTAAFKRTIHFDRQQYPQTAQELGELGDSDAESHTRMHDVRRLLAFHDGSTDDSERRGWPAAERRSALASIDSLCPRTSPRRRRRITQSLTAGLRDDQFARDKIYRRTNQNTTRHVTF